MIGEIKFLKDYKEVQKVYEFVKKFPLDYPNFFVWLDKCKKQLETGDKKSFYATSNGQIIGSVIFQTERKESSVLEIKNFRVAEEHSRKGVGSALEIMVCSYAKFNSYNKIQIDTHQNNLTMIQFLIKKGYTIEAEEYLYLLDKPEVILVKKL
ncbi:MAG: GNAT family N-acetyltransferase [Nanoarchaeota archaeon]|nr:GNAT family N-acetyltransferase [Nanoarchaeota archaeon]